MLDFIALCLGIALLAAALTGPFVYLAFVPAERRKREAAEGRAQALWDALCVTRTLATSDATIKQRQIDALSATLREIQGRDTQPSDVPEVPRRARTDTLVSE